MADMITRGVLILCGLACVSCEVWGAYDFMWEKYGRWNYLVVGSLVLTALAAVLPIAAEFAHRNGRRGLKWTAWAAVPLALAFVFTVSIQRTGTATDTDEASRRQGLEAIRIARSEESEAAAQLIKDQKTEETICAIWGPKCTQAKEDKRATEAKLATARATLKKHGVVVDDSMARRLIAYFPFLTKEQVQLWQPMLMPLGLAFIGAILIAIGVHRRKPEAPRPDMGNSITAKVEPVATIADARAAFAAGPPPDLDEIKPRPRPKLVAVRKTDPAGPVAEIMTAALERAKGRVSLGDCYLRYVAESKAVGRQPLTPDQFMDAMSAFCKGAGIDTKIIGDELFLLGVQLVTNQAKVTKM